MRVKAMLTLMILISVTGQAIAAEGGGAAPHWYRDSWLLPASGVIVALILCVVVWLTRKVMGYILVSLSMLLCAGLILLAIFGRELGVYSAIFRLMGIE